ncbi:MAG: amidase, partial [Pseudolabrys sp.]
MRFCEYLDYDGLGLAALIAKKEIAPLEVVDEAIARAETLNPTLNAIIFDAYERARDAAKTALAPGPFRGVPM